MRLFDFLTDVGRAVAYYPALARVFGVKETVLLCQLIYWSDKTDDGWIFKRSAELTEETGLSYKEQKRARLRLSCYGILCEREDRLNHQLWFKVNFEKLGQVWENKSTGQQPEGTFGNSPKGLSGKSLWGIGGQPEGTFGNSPNGRSTYKIDDNKDYSRSSRRCAASQAGAAAPCTPAHGHAPAPQAAMPPNSSSPPLEDEPRSERAAKGFIQLASKAYQSSFKLKPIWTAEGRESVRAFFTDNPEIWNGSVLRTVVEAWQIDLSQTDMRKYYYCQQIRNVNHIFRVHPKHGVTMIVGAAQELGLELGEWDEEKCREVLKEADIL